MEKKSKIDELAERYEDKVTAVVVTDNDQSREIIKILIKESFIAGAQTVNTVVDSVIKEMYS